MQYELLIFLVMLAAFLLMNLALKLPVSISMALGAAAGALAAGEGFPFRHFFEGAFVYIDTILIISTAMIFMTVIEKSGAVESISRAIIRRFHKYRPLMLIMLMFIVMFPGMITGSSAAAVLSTGSIVAPILIAMGIPSAQAGAIIAIGAIMGMAAPPVNIPAMLIAGGVDMPFIGFEGPLFFLSIPCAIFTVLFVGLRHCKKIEPEDLETAGSLGENMPAGGSPLMLLPVLTVVFLLVATRTLLIPNLGMPLIFMIGAVIGAFTGKRVNFMKTVSEAMNTTIPVLGKLIGVGMFIQIMTLTGVRGYIVISCFGAGAALLYVAIAIAMPAFGAVSSYGAASVLGVPFLLALLTGNQIVTACALSFICCLGDLMPPTALAGNYAAQLVKLKYAKLLKHCLIPFAVCLGFSLAVLIFSKNFGFLV